MQPLPLTVIPVANVDEELQLLLGSPPQRVGEHRLHRWPLRSILVHHCRQEVDRLGLMTAERREVGLAVEDVGVTSVAVTEWMASAYVQACGGEVGFSIKAIGMGKEER